MKLVLGSGSPRRREVLETLGLAFEVEAPDVDETRFPEESPDMYVERVARAKAAKLAGPDRVVLAGDTAVAVDGRILGKPGHPEEARGMLRRLQGRRHEVFTGVAVAVARPEVEIVSLLEVTEVTLVAMTDDEIATYVAGGEPMDKAGAYALQGRGGVFVSSVFGSPTNVIGLPVHLLPRLFRKLGLELDEFQCR